jgi:hypothetical protein
MNLKEKLWNPMGFFISLFMSFLMPLIVAVPLGRMSIYILFVQWLMRWIIAYFLVTILVIPLSLKLAQKFFTFPPKGRYWNPVAFFISLNMSFLMPLIVAYGMGSMPLFALIAGWPIRWVIAYFLVTLIVMPTSIRLAGYFFNFEGLGKPQKH